VNIADKRATFGMQSRQATVDRLISGVWRNSCVHCIHVKVFALALLLNIHVWAWIGLFIVHWFLMTCWITSQKTNFCKTRGKEIFYDVVVG